VTVTYADGSSCTADVNFTDWILGFGEDPVMPGNTIAAQTPYLNTIDGHRWVSVGEPGQHDSGPASVGPTAGDSGRRRVRCLRVAYGAPVLRRELLSDVRYDAELDLRSNRSRTVVRFRCLSPGASSYADLAVASVESMSLNGSALAASAWRDGRVALSDLGSSNALEVTANVSNVGDDRGLVWFVDDGGERFVYTHGRTDGVARWAPCFLDVPARWDLRVVVPNEWTVLSHCPSLSSPDGGVFRFLPPYPLPDGPTFAAGRWTRVEGPDRVPMWARPSMADALARSPVGEWVASALAFHEQILEVPYPYETRDCVFIPGYPSQAGCSGGLIVFHERVLRRSFANDWARYVRWVIAHETAHSWFGDLVGFSSDEHRWTAEGIATYLCHRANASWDRFHVLEELEAHEDDDAAAAGAPSLIYAKPAAVVRHLESIIGESAVGTGLTSWLRRHAGGSSTGDHLVGEWSAAAGLDLSAWALDWLATPGVNTLSFDPSASVVHQTGRPVRSHHLTIQVFDHGLAPREPTDLVVTEAATPVPAKAVRDAALVVLNAPPRTYAKVRLDPRSRATLAGSLGALGDEVRAVCWVAGVEMVRDGLMPAAELAAWVDTFASSEPDPQVRALLSTALER
jgi:aminopeptidase N